MTLSGFYSADGNYVERDLEVRAQASDPSTPATPLNSLQPRYIESEHKHYLGWLTTALDAADTAETLAPRNVALTGGYGVGKSSVLGEFARRNSKRAVPVTLSTLAAPTASGGSNAEGQPEATSQTIQSSIVKQLLYSVAPNEVPGSRFRRIETFDPRRAVLVSLVIALVLTAAAYVTDLLARAEIFVAWKAGWVTLIWVVAFLGTVAVLTLIQGFAHHRFRLERFSAGPATIGLKESDEKTFQSYFDKYLDEIVYFFQVTGYDVVIFEDLDRFDDADIFEQLRELNTILNSAKQIPQRPIRFVYAVRDSLFETAAELPPGGLSSADTKPSDRLRGRDVAGDTAPSVRAKFFDLVIPRVPFATQRTSRDLLRRALSIGDRVPDERLVATAAPFFQDMRVISNIANEFEVFARHVLTPTVTGLRPEALAAMVLYKNTYLADYERIRMSTSNLDKVARGARAYVRAAIGIIDLELGAVLAEINSPASAIARALEFGERIEAFGLQGGEVFRVANAVRFEIDGDRVTPAELRTPQLWERLANPSSALSVRLNGGTAYAIPRNVIENVIGSALSSVDWADRDAAPFLEQHDRLVSERELLVAGRYEDLIKSSRAVEWEPPNLEKRNSSFRAFAVDVLGEGLAIELIAGGFIDRNFSLYLSRYIGDTTSANALNFVIKHVQTSEPAFDYELSNEDVAGVIAEVGETLFLSPSAVNLGVADALLGDPRFGRVLDRVADLSSASTEFLDAYLAAGAQPEALIAGLASRWPGLLQYLSQPERGSAGVQLMSRALRSAPSSAHFLNTPLVRTFIENHLHEMTVSTDENDAVEASRIASRLAAMSVKVPDVNVIGDQLRDAIIELGAFRITMPNLHAAVGEEFALEKIAERPQIFDAVIRDLDGYLAALNDSGLPAVTSEEDLPRMLDIIASVDASKVAAVASAAAPGLRVTDLTELGGDAWRGAVEASRVILTISNVDAYLVGVGADSQIVAALEASPFFVLEERDTASAREAIASKVSALEELRVDSAARLISSLGIEDPLPISSLSLREGELLPELARLGVLRDDADTFRALAPLTWGTKARYIRVSSSFTSYWTDLDWTDGEIAALITSEDVPHAVRDAVVRQLESLRVGLGAISANALLNYAGERGVPFTAGGLRMVASAHPEAEAMLAGVAASIDQVDDVLVIELLSALAGDIGDLTRRGNRPLIIPNVDGLEVVLERLKKLEFVSTFTPSGDGTWRVHMRRA